jgi:hypothetical protein
MEERPIILTCNIDVSAMMHHAGNGNVFHSRGILSVRGHVSANILCDDPTDVQRAAKFLELPDQPAALARWINRLLELPPHRGVRRRDPGVLRLAKWIQEQIARNPSRQISEFEVAEVASHWLPEFFRGVAVDPARMRSLRFRGSATGDLTTLIPSARDDVSTTLHENSAVESEALLCLASDKPRRRIRGLRLLSSIASPGDLVDWCLMLLDDEDVEVAVAALQNLACHCEQVDRSLVEELTSDQDRRLRAAALEVLAVHDPQETGRWLWQGLSDPEAHVRMRLVRHLDRLDPALHPDVFHTALTDPNPEIARLARRRSEGRGIHMPAW